MIHTYSTSIFPICLTLLARTTVFLLHAPTSPNTIVFISQRSIHTWHLLKEHNVALRNFIGRLTAYIHHDQGDMMMTTIFIHVGTACIQKNDNNQLGICFIIAYSFWTIIVRTCIHACLNTKEHLYIHVDTLYLLTELNM